MNMTRHELLKKLNSIKYNVLWPDWSWKDIGFTEHPIWVNGLGYGYYSCDEPNVYYKARRIPDNKLRIIKSKLREDTLTIEDIQDTSLGKMWFCDESEESDLRQLKNLLALPDSLQDYYYCGEGVDEILFFDSLEGFLDYFAHDYADVEWKDLGDEELALWVDRIYTGNYADGFSFFEEV